MSKQNHPLISVILATYNGEIYLREQIDSLLQQTYPNIEILAIDDGSTDNTVSLLTEYASLYSNIKIYVNDKNLGFIKNFEKGCRLSSGEFIAPCDQDDYWLPDKLQKKIEAIGCHAMIYCDSDVCNEYLQPTGKKISDIVICRNWYSCLEYAVFARIYGHALLFRRSLFDKAFPFLDIIPHDWWLAFNATLHGGLAFLPESLILYRQHDNNLYGVVDRKKMMNCAQPLIVQQAKNEKIHRKEKKERSNTTSRLRISIFYTQCPAQFVKEKWVLYKLYKSYESFSLPNNMLRMITFLQYHKLLLATKKRSRLRKYLFCLKMFTTLK